MMTIDKSLLCTPHREQGTILSISNIEFYISFACHNYETRKLIFAFISDPDGPFIITWSVDNAAQTVVEGPGSSIYARAPYAPPSAVRVPYMTYCE